MPLPADNDEPPSFEPTEKPPNLLLRLWADSPDARFRAWLAFFLTLLLGLVAWEHAEPDGALFSHRYDHVRLTQAQSSPDLDAAGPALDLPPERVDWVYSWLTFGIQTGLRQEAVMVQCGLACGVPPRNWTVSR